MISFLLRKGMIVATAASLSQVCAYEIPTGVYGIGELEKAQEQAARTKKPLVAVVALKSQPET